MSALSLVLDTPELAHQYEQVSADRQFKVGRRLVSKLRIARGERVLDVGSGTGLLAEHVVSLVGPEGLVVGIDPLPLRIEIAQRKARANLSFRVADANSLAEFDDASFDVVYLNAVFHWLPEKLGPLREFARVLKPNGRLGISTGEKGSNSLREIRSRVLARDPFRAHVVAGDQVGHNVRAPELQQLLEQTGFAIDELSVEPHSTLHQTASAAIDFAQASSFGNFLGRLPEALRADARVQLERELEKTRTPDGIPQKGARIIAIARKR